MQQKDAIKCAIIKIVQKTCTACTKRRYQKCLKVPMLLPGTIIQMEWDPYLHNYFKVPKNVEKICSIYDDGENVHALSYGEVDEFSELVKTLLEEFGVLSGFIGVMHPKNHYLPAIHLGVLRTGCGFFSMDEWSLNRLDNALSFTLILCDSEKWNKIKANGGVGLKECGRITKMGLTLCCRQDEVKVRVNWKPHQYAYAIQTSGTTGKKKLVLVPHSCIIPNIRDFGRIWKVGEDDIFWGSSPPSFDPSIVDMFTAFGAGGTIIFTSYNCNANDGKLLGEILMKHKVSVIQTTPSFFRKVGNNLARHGLFNETVSALRILAFGGEKCCSKEELRDLIVPEMGAKLRIFNLYGLTELSCWATYTEIDFSNNNPIGIGSPLSETRIETKQHETDKDHYQIVLSSDTRWCTVVAENGTSLKTQKLDTGDLAIHLSGTLELLFLGRCDSIVKRSGIKVPLALIEASAIATGLITTAHAVDYEEKIYLIVVLKNNYKSNPKKIQASFLSNFHLDIHPEFYPNSIIGLNSIPLNENGKLDVSLVLRLAEREQEIKFTGNYELDEITVRATLHPLWLIGSGRKGILSNEAVKVDEENFYEVGGSSVTAVWMLESFFTSINLYGSPLFSNIRESLLTSLRKGNFSQLCCELTRIFRQNPMVANISVIKCDNDNKLCKYDQGIHVEIEPGSTWRKAIAKDPPVCHNHSIFRSSPKEVSISYPIKLLRKFDYNLHMCVDSTPAISISGCKPGVIVSGSHSGTIVAVDTSKLLQQKSPQKTEVLWSRTLSNRVEAEAVINSQSTFVYIGAHNKMLYKLSLIDGSTDASFQCDSAIRTKVVLSSDETKLVVVDNCNTLYCLSSWDLKQLWKISIKEGLSPVQRSPLIESDHVIIPANDGGIIHCFSLENGKQLWSKQLRHKRNQISSNLIVWNCPLGKVILYGTQNGFQMRDVSMGSLVLNWKNATEFTESQKTHHYHSPIIHECKREALLISLDGKTGFKISWEDNEEGMEVDKFALSRSSPVTALAKQVICTTLKEESANRGRGSKKCLLLFKEEENEYFTFCDLDDPTVKEPLLAYPQVANNYSNPSIYRNIISFGGRDDRLHVLICDIFY